VNKPLYRQVYETVIERISNGQYVPGGMLPNEFDLAANLHVSQGTARKALRELERAGIVERRQGKGTFVTLRTPENSLFHFFRLRTKSGDQVVPALQDEVVSLRRASKLEMDTLHGGPLRVYEINRVRQFQGKALCHEMSIVSADRFPGLKDRAPLPNTVYVLFQQAYSCVIISADEHLEATLLDADLAQKLQQPIGAPALRAIRVSRDLKGDIVEMRTSTYLTGDARYFVDMN